MKRLATWVFYAVGALAIGYLALYAYGALTGNRIMPGDPIRIYRKEDAPDYSGLTAITPRPRGVDSRQYLIRPA